MLKRNRKQKGEAVVMVVVAIMFIMLSIGSSQQYEKDHADMTNAPAAVESLEE